MTEERIRELESVGFVWDLQELAWHDQFQQLCDYKELSGDCNVPHKSSAYKKLGSWVAYQRQQYRLYQENKPNQMTEKRIQELKSVGFVWDLQELAWREDQFRQLRDYKELSGDCNVPHKSSTYKKLNTWVSTQRNQYRLFHQEGKPSSMIAEHIRELDGIGFIWDARS